MALDVAERVDIPTAHLDNDLQIGLQAIFLTVGPCVRLLVQIFRCSANRRVQDGVTAVSRKPSALCSCHIKSFLQVHWTMQTAPDDP